MVTQLAGVAAISLGFYNGDAWSNSQPVHQLTLMQRFFIFLSPSRQITGQYLD